MDYTSLFGNDLDFVNILFLMRNNFLTYIYETLEKEPISIFIHFPEYEFGKLTASARKHLSGQ